MHPDTAALEQLLAFYRDAGVDVALSEEPVDRFAESAAEAAARKRQQPVPEQPAIAEPAPPPPPPAPALSPAPPRREPPSSPAVMTPAPAPIGAVPDADAVMEARELAGGAESLDALRALLERFEGCMLKRTATNLCFADGNPEGRVMLVGEAPGRDEDIQGLPFVGRSGQLLDRMLAAIGLDRDSVYIANTVPWRPPGNRTPTPQETEICRPFIERQIVLANPDFLVPLGSPAAKMLFATSDGITRLRGKWRDYVLARDDGPRTIRAMATLHPAYLLRQPLQKRLAWRDWLALKAALDGR